MRIIITGGGGYVGSALVPKLLARGHQVTVLDTFWFGDCLGEDPNLFKIRGDIRIRSDLRAAFHDQFAAIHLACISNDPSFDMNPTLGKSINLDCFPMILQEIKSSSVKKFIYASSSSVYGVSELQDVTESSPKKPLTDYSKFKLECEEQLARSNKNFPQWTIFRPATVCGYAPRQRLDLVVNILTMQALVNKNIMLFGRDQKRPNIHVEDMADAYLWALEANPKVVASRIFNVGFENYSIRDLAELIVKELGGGIKIHEWPTKDPRSYHINSDLIGSAGFKPANSIQGAIRSLARAYNEGRFKDPLSNPEYQNIQRMKELQLT